MADTTDKQDPRLGRFLLGRRCKHAAAELGPIHEARHLDTGAPALVMTPGARASWWPRTSWRVRIHVQLIPPHIGVEIEQAPSSGRLSGLISLLCLVLAGVEAVKHDLRMRTHLTHSRPGQRRWPYLPHALAALSVLLLAVGLWLASRHPLTDPSVATATVSAIGNTATAVVSPPMQIDQEEPSTTAIGYPLPEKPFAEQSKPPCRVSDADEREIHGGCWIEVVRRAPCARDQAEHQGRCYVPVALKKPPPQAVSP